MKVVILDNLRSLHNVGSIFRTADGAGFQKIYCCGYTGTPPDRRIEKVSLGAEDFIEWEKSKTAAEICQKLKAEGYTIIALEQTERSENIFKIKITDNHIVIILGNEVEGISEEALKLADQHLEIPMFGKKSSLNVSVAAGIALYELNRRR